MVEVLVVVVISSGGRSSSSSRSSSSAFDYYKGQKGGISPPRGPPVEFRKFPEFHRGVGF